MASPAPSISRRGIRYDFKQGFSGYANAGAEYADLVGKVAPQGQLMTQWNNGTFGVLGMVFYDKEDLRRDAQEELGYGSVPAATAAAWQAANPSLPNASGALYPTLLGQTLFEQTQDKKGGLIDIQAKPSDALSLDLTGFFSYMDAGNNRQGLLQRPLGRLVLCLVHETDGEFPVDPGDVDVFIAQQPCVDQRAPSQSAAGPCGNRRSRRGSMPGSRSCRRCPDGCQSASRGESPANA